MLYSNVQKSISSVYTFLEWNSLSQISNNVFHYVEQCSELYVLQVFIPLVVWQQQLELCVISDEILNFHSKESGKTTSALLKRYMYCLNSECLGQLSLN